MGRPGDHACRTCGGSLRDGRDGAAPAFEHRIGRPDEALELWVAHCTARNAALEVAAGALAENAALARTLAARSRERGNHAAAARIAEEAGLEELYHEQVRHMLDGLEADDPAPA